MSVPWLAIAAASMASCSGVAWSSSWPIELIAVNDGSVILGITLGETGIGIVRFASFQPNLLAWLCRAGPPTFMPMFANAVLQDSRKAWMTCGLPPKQVSSPSLLRRLPLGSRSGCGAETVACGLATLPVENPAEPVMILNEEPG